MPNEKVIQHDGVTGMKWGIRRYQPYGKGGYNPKRIGKYIGDPQKEEYKFAKRNGGKAIYKGVYERATKYYNKSKTIQERSKELNGLADKAQKLDLDLERELRTSNVHKEAYKLATDRATKAAKSLEEFDSLTEKEQAKVIESFLYDGDYLEKAEKELSKNNTKAKELRKQRNAAIKEYKEKCSQIADEIIGKYGNKKLSGLSDDKNVTYKELVTYALNIPNMMWMFTYEEELGRA